MFTFASQTSRTVVELICLYILTKYIKLVYEPPFAKNRSVRADFSCAGIASLRRVFFFLFSCRTD